MAKGEKGRLGRGRKRGRLEVERKGHAQMGTWEEG
jgi:hypothetical protein